MHFRRTLLFIVVAAVTAFAQSSHKKAAAKHAPASTKTGPAAAATDETKPVSRPKSFDLDAMDKSVNPCQDFYEYACGNWRKKNPIPPDQARWGRFNELAEYNRQLLH